MLIIPVLFASCATNGPVVARWPAEESAIPGVPVPRGSLESRASTTGAEGSSWPFMPTPGWTGEQVPRFYEEQMPAWGLDADRSGRAPAAPALLRARRGVPVLIGVEATEDAGQGSRFSIIRGARGDWGFMPRLREPQ